MFTLFLTILFLGTAGTRVCAHEALDMEQRGSIRITMHQGKNIVSGGTMTLYQVGAAEEDDGNYRFVLTDDFADSKESLEDIQSAELAEALAQYAGSRSVKGTTKKIGDDGNVSFGKLEPGLYLLVQNRASSGYRKAAPFLVSVPQQGEEGCVYEVDASPKLELERVSDPSNPDGSDGSTGSSGGSGKAVSAAAPLGAALLPQTGQLNWPIPVLTVLGIALFSAGWMLRFGKKNGYEK